MKKEKFMKAIGDIDDELLLHAEISQKKKSGMVKKIVLIAAIVTLISALAVSLVIANSVSSGENENETNELETNELESDETPVIDSAYWQDTRKKNGKSVASSERGIVWPWNCRAVYNQYTSVNVNGVKYRAQSSYYGISVEAARIGDKIGDFTCEGFDDYEEKKHSINCSVYEIEGLDSNRFIAVKYEGYEEFYPFMPERNSTVNTPATLGELIDVLDLTNNIKLNKFYVEDEYSVCYTLSDEKSAELWNMIKEYTTVSTEHEFGGKSRKKVISFAINSSVLGVNNLSFSFYKEGYLFTNIESFGYYYNIGADAVEKIADFVIKNKQGVWVDETQYLVGTVTEIGENYIKVDDSIFMKNPEEGIEFTVYAEHMNIKRYIISGYLSVGMTVSIKHGYLPKENYVEIRNATELEECFISSNGEVLIPE